MARGMPSLGALLGLVAIAGYQNRDKIGEFVKGLGISDPNSPLGGILEGARKSLGGSATGTDMNSGLGELVDRFRQNGQGATADSWVATGANKPINDSEVERALGPDLIDSLAKQTGLSRADLLSRLASMLPDVVDKMTPGGRLPQ
ncbi:YidB family protein [Nordella sp. HKS 07]|uniref:YidB family protein n=1 Tax=Nordella sp. HKS 07 TaxID=2712222 RepID=UPI0013E14FE4|nr:YidB family protein [Nordella sp. HKS 07]QIG47929.1 YidB family protein [Nordella sp. HKS 07]